jgi:hypothetical protein
MAAVSNGEAKEREATLTSLPQQLKVEDDSLEGTDDTERKQSKDCNRHQDISIDNDVTSTDSVTSSNQSDLTHQTPQTTDIETEDERDDLASSPDQVSAAASVAALYYYFNYSRQFDLFQRQQQQETTGSGDNAADRKIGQSPADRTSISPPPSQPHPSSSLAAAAAAASVAIGAGGGYENWLALSAPRPSSRGTATCHLCQLTFHDNLVLKEHVEKVHPREMYRCTVPGCDKIFSTRKSRNRHSQNDNLHYSATV